MKISIITVCYNSAGTIEDTIKSIISQNHADLEYIIIDGGSTDNTLEIINKYKDKIAKIISEPDKGIYDAMNKGIGLTTGEVVGIINSDDFYEHYTVLDEVVNCFENSKIDACYGNIKYVDRLNIDKQVRFWKAGHYEKKKLNSGWIMPHPAFFIRKEVYNRLGLFNLDFRIAADYELMLRFLKNNIEVQYLDVTLVCMREGGFSGQSFKQRQKGWNELKRAWTTNNLLLPKFFIIRRLISKINQYIL